jgi:hypothetical protein
MSETRVEDAISAQSSARRYLESQFGMDKIKNILFSRTWYSTGASRDIWEVEGDVEIKKGMFGKMHRHFKFQIDPDTSRVIAFDA